LNIDAIGVVREGSIRSFDEGKIDAVGTHGTTTFVAHEMQLLVAGYTGGEGCGGFSGDDIVVEVPLVGGSA
jgi:hypothetical protein